MRLITQNYLRISLPPPIQKMPPPNSRPTCSTVRYGTVRCGTVRYGTVRYGTGTGTVRYGTVRHNTVRYGTGQYGTVRYGTVQYGTVRYGTVRYGTVRYGTVRYGTVPYSTSLFHVPYPQRTSYTVFIIKHNIQAGYILIFYLLSREIVDECTKHKNHKKHTHLNATMTERLTMINHWNSDPMNNRQSTINIDAFSHHL
jgi:hypothetical protein